MKKTINKVFKDSTIAPFLICMAAFGLVVGVYNGFMNNYLHEILNMDQTERGFLELPRELPGLLLFLFMAVLYRFSEYKVLRTSIIIAFIGMGGLLFLGDFKPTAITAIFLWSLGEHLIMPVRSSVAVHHARPGNEGLALGAVRGFVNAGQAAGYYLGPLLLVVFSLIWGKGYTWLTYRTLFAVCMVLLIVAFFFSGRLKDDKEKVVRKRIYFDRKYTKYYWLEVFFGARKQVFLTFAPFVLILNYNAGPELISLLYGIWSVINIFVGPLIGRLIDRAGYRKVLVWDSVALILLCLLYGFSHRIFPFSIAFVITCVVFVLDSMTFAFGMARDMYAKSKSETQAEFSATLSTGLSVNHLISIFIAMGGGLLWQKWGIELLFSIAAFIAMGSLFFALSLKKPVSVKN